MSILKLIKNEGAATVFSIHNMLFILTKFEQSQKKTKKQKNEQPWTLVYTLVFQIMSSPFNFFFWSRPNDFLSKMIPCKINHDFNCLGPGPLSKSLRTKLKLLINRNASYHRTLLLKPLSKVGLNILVFFKKDIHGYMVPSKYNTDFR